MSLRRLPLVIVALTCLPPLGADTMAVNPTTAITLDQVEEGVLWLLNAERTSAGLASLKVSGDLSGAARAHSENMKTEGYVGSVGPDGTGPQERYASAGATSVDESVVVLQALGVTAAAPARVHYTLMADDVYRQGLLAESTNSVGVGCAADENGTVWATVAFAQIPQTPEPSAEPGADAADATAADAASLPATAPAAGVVKGVTAPVKTFLWHTTSGPEKPLVVSVAAGAGEYVRAVVSVPAGTPVVADASCPDTPDLATPLTPSAELSVPTHDRLLAWPRRPLSKSGDYVLRVQTTTQVPCRVAVVTGPPLAVLAYGVASRAALPVAWNTTVYGSPGDAGGAETYQISIAPDQRGKLTFTPLGPGFAATVALFGPDDRQVGRWRPEQIAANLEIPLEDPDPGVYILTVVNPGAGPDGDDFQLRLEQ